MTLPSGWKGKGCICLTLDPGPWNGLTSDFIRVLTALESMSTASGWSEIRKALSQLSSALGVLSSSMGGIASRLRGVLAERP